MNEFYPDRIWLPKNHAKQKQSNSKSPNSQQIPNTNRLTRIQPEPSPDYDLSSQQIAWINNPVYPTVTDTNAMRPLNYLYPIQQTSSIDPARVIQPSKSSIQPILPPIVKRSAKTGKASARTKILITLGTIGLVLGVLGVSGAIVGVFVVRTVTTDSTTTTTTASIVPYVKNCSEGFVGQNCEIECGGSFVTPNYLKIVGGQEAQPHSWPSIAYVYFSYQALILDDNGNKILIRQASTCGGTLLDKTTVLTAAHCIVNVIYYRNPVTGGQSSYNVVTNEFHPTIGSMFTVYLGLHDRTQLTSSGSEQMSVSNVYKHENYDEINTINDIAILKLSSEVGLSNTIQVACLPVAVSSSYPTPVKTSYAAGWGTLSYGGSVASILNDVSLLIYSSTSCFNVAPESSKSWDSQICAGDLTGTKDTCQGDSGGPLYIMDTVASATKYVTVGITSYGVGCGTLNKPAVYTRVSFYVNWIKQYMD